MRLSTSIQNKLMLMAMIPATIIAITLTLYSTSIRIDDIELLVNAKAQAMAEQIASENVNNIFTGNRNQITQNTKRYLENFSDLYKVRISSNDEVYFSDKKQSIPKTLSIYSSAEIKLPQTEFAFDDFGLDNDNVAITPVIIGKVELWLYDKNASHKQAIIRTAFMVVAITVVASILIIFPLSRRLTTPIRKLANAFSMLGRGNFDTRVDQDSSNEILTLQKGFNEMSSALANQHKQLNEEVDRVTRDLNSTLQALEIQNIELDIARKQAVESSRIKSEFLANMSHEIRTPMNGIIGYISLMERTSLDEEQHSYLTTINQSANSLLQILNDILDFSKLEAGKIRTHQSSFQLEELVSDVIELFTPQAYEKHLDLIPLIYNDVPAEIIADRQRLTQVLSNLISNSIKFTEQGEIVLRVAVESRTERHCILDISVSDTGIGISGEDINNLFQPFKQASSDYSRGYGGTGLGLSISRSLINIMKGNIKVESTPGQGATFSISLPTAIPEKSNPTMAPRYQDIFSDKQILLYDRNRLSRLSLKNTLQNMGFEVIEHETPGSFIDDIQQRKIDLLIISLDSKETVHMIDNGLELVDQISQPAIILVSVSDQRLLKHLSIARNCTFLKRPAFQKQLLPVLLQTFGSSDNLSLLPQTSIPGIDGMLTGKSILIVDDNKINQQLLLAMLKITNAVISVAANGKEALKACKEKQFDMIFMDIHMPEINGIEATRALRESGYTSPVIALTADAAFIEKNVSNNGFNTVLIKPVETEVLHKLIDDFASGRKITNVHSAVAAHQGGIIAMHHKVRDLQQALRIADGQTEVAEKLLMTVIEQLPDYIESAKREYSDKNWKKLWDVLHKLQGATSICGVPALNNTVKNLQKFIEQDDLYSIDAALGKLEQEAQRLLKYVKKNPE